MCTIMFLFIWHHQHQRTVFMKKKRQNTVFSFRKRKKQILIGGNNTILFIIPQILQEQCVFISGQTNFWLHDQIQNLKRPIEVFLVFLSFFLHLKSYLYYILLKNMTFSTLNRQTNYITHYLLNNCWHKNSKLLFFLP